MHLGNAIAWQFVCTTGYAAAILAFGGGSADLPSVLINEWIGLTNWFVRLVAFVLPESLHTFDALSLSAIYQHVLVFSLLIACAWLWISKASWDTWANQVYDMANCGVGGFRLRQKLRDSHGMMVLGAFFSIILLISLDVRLEESESWLVTEKWTYLRAPVLGTIFFACVCHAIAIRLILRSIAFEEA